MEDVAGGTVTKEFRLKMSAVLSCPSVGWNDHWGCVTEALRPWNIPIRKGKGAYWHQTMQMLLKSSVDAGEDTVLTLDYDSVFKRWHFARLLHAFLTTPEADAMAAFQVRRGSIETALCAPINPEITRFTLDGKPIEVASAHFGMTLIKTEALKRMPKPWFWSTPDENGDFGDGRIDADINFWRKFRECGNRVFVDPFCNIGHLQVLVSEFVQQGDAVVPVHTHMHDWMERPTLPVEQVSCEHITQVVEAV